MSVISMVLHAPALALSAGETHKLSAAKLFSVEHFLLQCVFSNDLSSFKWFAKDHED